MDNKKIPEKEEVHWNLFLWLTYVLRKNLILILAIIVLAAGVGTGYAIIRKYDYTSSCQISYTAKNVAYDYTTYNVSVMSAYLQTVIDFCDEGVVVDRANYYYDLFLKEQKKNPQLKAADFIEEYLKANDDYAKDKVVSEQYIDGSKIVSEEEKTIDNAVRFTFTIKYTDTVGQTANDKLTFIVYAATKEINNESDNESIYFAGLNINLQYLSKPSSTPAVSKKKVVLSATLIGIVLAIAVACVKELLDDTVKDEVELYRISNVEMFAYIYDIEGGISHA